jgi:hypothetical protein
VLACLLPIFNDLIVVMKALALFIAVQVRDVLMDNFFKCIEK